MCIDMEEIQVTSQFFLSLGRLRQSDGRFNECAFAAANQLPPWANLR